MNKYMFLILCCLAVLNVDAQVAINTNDAPPDESAILDISSTNTGILVPRMTSSERDAIPAPISKGLLVYVSDDSTFYYYNGVDWDALFADNLGNHQATSKLNMAGHDIDNGGTLSADRLKVNNKGLVVDNANKLVGIGTANPQTDLHIYNDLQAPRLFVDRRDNQGISMTIKTGTSNSSLGFENTGDFSIGPVSSIGGQPLASKSLNIDETGQVGLGTDQPGAQLEVFGGNILLDNDGYAYMKFKNGGQLQSEFGQIEESTFGITINSMIFSNKNRNNLNVIQNGISAIRINGSGKVGLYKNPTAALDVGGGIRIRTDNPDAGAVWRATSASGLGKWHNRRDDDVITGKSMNEYWYNANDTYYEMVSTGQLNNVMAGDKLTIDGLVHVRMLGDVTDEHDHPFFTKCFIEYDCGSDSPTYEDRDHLQTVKYESASDPGDLAEKFRGVPYLDQWVAPCDCRLRVHIETKCDSSGEVWKTKDRVIVVRKN